MKNLSQQIASDLVTIGAVKFTPNAPIRFKSGILSPVYVDNRIIPYYTATWEKVIAQFIHVAKHNCEPFDVIAGIATGGIPHSAVLAYQLKAPSVYVRKEEKEHGLKNRVEGGDVSGKRVLLVEDMITTGGSSLSGVTSLRDSGATVTECVAIVSYNFPEAKTAFSEANMTLHTLTTFPVILAEAQELGLVTEQTANLITDWLSDPHGWANRQGL